MSNSVDNRVVSMEFDNAKFERNVAQSLETLKHLDKSLDGLTNSSKKFDGVSFEDLANSIDSIANRFTLMGRITQKVFDEIASGIVNLGKKIISFNTDQLVSGWHKYADKTNSVQTIMSATGREIEYVEDQLSRLNRFTDETSYSFVDMTSNIAKFTSQGIELDEAITSMQGIATWAASAGQNAQSASRAMYNISQAMGAGSMKLIDWKSIQNANMATKEFKEQAIQAGLAAHTLVEQEGKIVTATGGVEVSVKNFDQTLQKGWFNTEAMTSVFTEYGKFADLIDSTYEEFDEKITVSKLLQLAEAQKKLSSSFEDDLAKAAKNAGVGIEDLRKAITALNDEQYEFSMKTYKSAQEARTFDDAVSAAADAVSTAWMNVFQTIFGNYEQQRVLWTDLANWFYDLFAQPVNELQGFLAEVMDGVGETSQASYTLQEAMDKSGVSLLDFGDSAVQALKSQGLLTDEMIESAGSIEGAMKQVTGTSDQFRSVIDKMLESNVASIETAEEAFEDYKKVAKEVLRGDWGNGHERVDALEAAGYDSKTVQLLAEKMHLGMATLESDMWRVELRTKGFTEAEIEALEKFRDSLVDTGDTADETADKIEKLSGRELLFGKEEGARGIVYNLMDTITEFGNAVSDAWDKVFPKGDRNPVENAHKLLVRFNKFTAGLLDTVRTSDKLGRILKGLFAAFDIGKRTISGTIGIIRTFFTALTGNSILARFSLGELIAKFADWIVKLDDAIKQSDLFNKAMERIPEVVNKVRDKLGIAFNKISETTDKVKTKLEPYAERISTAWGALKIAMEPVIDKFKELWNSLKESGALEKVSQAISTGLNAVLEGTVGLIEKLLDLFPKLVDSVANFLSANLPNYIFSIRAAFQKLNFESIFGSVDKVRTGISDFVHILGDFIKTRNFEKFVKDINDRFGELIQRIEEFGKKVRDLFSGADSNKFAALATLASGILTFLGILEVVKKFTTIRTAFVSLLGAISGAIRAFTYNMKFNYILKIAGAITVLALALVALSAVPADNLKNASKALGNILVFIGMMTVIIAVVSAFPALSARMAAVGTAIAAFSASILLVVLALKMMESIAGGQAFLANLGKLVLVMMSLATVAGMMSKASITLTGSGIGVIAFAAAVLLLVKALKSIQDNAKLITPTAFKGLFSVMLLVSLMSIAMRGIKVTSALGLLLFAASLVAIEKALIKAMENSIPFDQFKTYWKEFLAILAMLSGIALVTRIGGKGSIKAVLMMVALIGAMYLSIDLIKRLGKIEKPELERGVITIVAIGGIFAAVLAATGKMSGVSKSTVTAMIAATVAIGLLLAALVVLTAIVKDEGNASAMLKALGAIAGVMLALGLAFAGIAQLTKYQAGWKNIAAIIAAIVAFGAVFYAIYELSTIVSNSDTLLTVCESLGLVMLALSASMAILSKASFVGFDTTQAWQMIIKMLALAAVAIAALWALQQFNIQASLPTVAALSLLMVALAFAARIISGAETDFGSAAGQALLVVGLAAAMYGIAMAMVKLNEVNVEGIIPKALALAALFGALSGAAAVLGSIDHFSAWSALKGLTVVILAIGEFALLAWGLVELGIMQKLSEFSTEIVTGFGALGGALGNLIGQFVGELISGALQGLAGISSFASALEPLMDQLERFDSTSVAAVGVLADLVLALTAASFTDGLALLGPLKASLDKLAGTDMASRLADLGNAVVAYVDSLKGFSEEDINKAARITNAMSNLFKAIDKEGGFFKDVFSGTKSDGMANLAKSLGGDEGFGAAIKSFVSSIKGISDEDVTATDKVNQIVTKISAMTESIGKSGGLLQELTGESNMAVFGTRILGFVRAIAGGTLPDGTSTEGILQLVKELPEDTSDFDKLSSITEALKNAVSGMPEMGGLFEKVFGSDDPSAFGEDMITYVGQIVEIGEKGKEITEDVLTGLGNIVLASEAMKSMQSAIGGPESASGSGDFSFFSSIKSFASTVDLPSLTTNMNGLATSVTGLVNIPVAGSPISMLPSVLGQNTDAMGALSEATGMTADEMMQTYSTMIADASEAGTETTTNLKEGIASGTPEVVAATENTSVEATQGLNAGIPTAYASGANYALGFAAGILDYISAVEDAVRQMAAAANTTLTVTIDAHSPSRIAEGRGENYSEGFAIGISKRKNLVENATESMANVAISALLMASTMIDDILATDGQPTITPVLDLSEVRNGVRSISNLGSFRASVSANTVGAVSMARDDMLASKNQNGTPAPVTAVLSDSAARALAGSRQTANKTVIEFTGDLAQLARVLHPVIVDQYNYHGDKLIK